MNRREAISSAALLFGGTIIGAEAFLYGCTAKKENSIATIGNGDLALLDEVGETILPATASSPGAKEARVGKFMQAMVNDCYSEKERKVFLDGIQKLQEFSNRKYGKDFLKLNKDEKHSLLLDLETETASGDDELHYYTLIKQLAILGFLTSEVGATKAMRHIAVPGRHDACVPYNKGEKAWV